MDSVPSGGTTPGASTASAEDRVAAVHGLQDAYRDHVREYGGPAVRHERQREAGHRHDPDGHADVDEGLQAEPQRDAGRDQQAELVVRPAGDAQRAEDHDAQQEDDHGAADEADLLARDADDEAGLLVGHEARGDQRAVQPAGAEQAPGPDHDLGVNRLVPGSRRVRRRMQERGQPVQLVAAEQVQLEHRHHPEHARYGQARQPAQLQAGQRDHAGRDEQQQDDHAQGRLAFDQGDRDQRQHEDPDG